MWMEPMIDNEASYDDKKKKYNRAYYLAQLSPESKLKAEIKAGLTSEQKKRARLDRKNAKRRLATRLKKIEELADTMPTTHSTARGSHKDAKKTPPKEVMTPLKRSIIEKVENESKRDHQTSEMMTKQMTQRSNKRMDVLMAILQQEPTRAKKRQIDFASSDEEGTEDELEKGNLLSQE